MALDELSRARVAHERASERVVHVGEPALGEIRGAQARALLLADARLDRRGQLHASEALRIEPARGGAAGGGELRERRLARGRARGDQQLAIESAHGLLVGRDDRIAGGL